MDPLKRLQTDDQLQQLLEAWEVLRKQCHEMPAQAVTALLYVASHNPCHKQAIEEDLKLTTASSSRMLDFLCDGPGRKGVEKPGLGLVSKYPDTSNGRRILLKLTPKGEELIAKMKGIIWS